MKHGLHPEKRRITAIHWTRGGTDALGQKRETEGNAKSAVWKNGESALRGVQSPHMSQENVECWRFASEGWREESNVFVRVRSFGERMHRF